MLWPASNKQAAKSSGPAFACSFQAIFNAERARFSWRNRPRWEALLRRYFSRTRTVLRPVKIQDWDGDRAAIGYALKYQFGRRISDLGLRSSGERVCKVTSYDRLRSRERVELYSYLHEIGLGARILSMGIESSPPPLLRLD
jgi:hypothetical protein